MLHGLHLLLVDERSDLTCHPHSLPFRSFIIHSIAQSNSLKSHASWAFLMFSSNMHLVFARFSYLSVVLYSLLIIILLVLLALKDLIMLSPARDSFFIQASLYYGGSFLDQIFFSIHWYVSLLDSQRYILIKVNGPHLALHFPEKSFI